MRLDGLALLFAVLVMLIEGGRAWAVRPSFRVESVIDVGPAWSAIPVGITLLNHEDRQFVAYYDDRQRMTVATRKLDDRRWDKVQLDQTIGWDAHNSVTMTVDDDGCLHLSGNMHSVPLVYYRTTKPGDIHSFERVPHMIGKDEQRCTYPAFLRGPDGELIFRYRNGTSGNGEMIYNVYDHGAKTWKRLLDQPLTDGEGKMNAYHHGPVHGPDGYYHQCWVWRDNGGCETNHDLCYARSKDLVHWETSDGKPLELPITLGTSEIVDPVPAKGGIINGNHRIGFDRKQRVVITYHKFDADGNTQIYNARREADGWKIYQTTNWDYRWYFHGGGCIQFDVRPGNVRVDSGGGLRLAWRHKKYGSGQWRLDEDTFKIIEDIHDRPLYPAEVHKVRSDYPGMKVRWTNARGRAADGARYALRMETLDVNRDKPRDEVPPATPLQLHKFARVRSPKKHDADKAAAKPAKGPVDADGRPLVKKLGTIDCDMVETTPIVFHGKLYRFEYVRDKYYKPNTTGQSYFRFVDVATGEYTPAFAQGYHLGSAHVQGDFVYVYGVNDWGGSELRVWWSKDLKTWETKVAINQPGHRMYNNSVCNGPDGYVMAVELGEPKELVGHRFTNRFAFSRDLLTWEWLGPRYVYSKDRYTACPSIRWLDGWYYMIYLEARPGRTYEPWIVRSKDLLTWQQSPLNPVMRHGDEDKKIGNPKLTPEQRAHIAGATNINNCDVDLCEFKGKTIIVYCWGNQQGTEFLAHAVYEGTIEQFLKGFFP